jgi:hypothetical protein
LWARSIISIILFLAFLKIRENEIEAISVFEVSYWEYGENVARSECTNYLQLKANPIGAAITGRTEVACAAWRTSSCWSIIASPAFPFVKKQE